MSGGCPPGAPAAAAGRRPPGPPGPRPPRRPTVRPARPRRTPPGGAASALTLLRHLRDPLGPPGARGEDSLIPRLSRSEQAEHRHDELPPRRRRGPLKVRLGHDQHPSSGTRRHHRSDFTYSCGSLIVVATVVQRIARHIGGTRMPARRAAARLFRRVPKPRTAAQVQPAQLAKGPWRISETARRTRLPTRRPLRRHIIRNRGEQLPSKS